LENSGKTNHKTMIVKNFAFGQTEHGKENTWAIYWKDENSKYFIKFHIYYEVEYQLITWSFKSIIKHSVPC
jgi:hypothetical protein